MDEKLRGDSSLLIDVADSLNQREFGVGGWAKSAPRCCFILHANTDNYQVTHAGPQTHTCTHTMYAYPHTQTQILHTYLHMHTKTLKRIHTYRYKNIQTHTHTDIHRYTHTHAY